MDPFKVVALSDMTIQEARNIVFDRVKDKFLADQVQIENIELAYRRKVDAPRDLIQQYNYVMSIHRQQGIPMEECPAQPIFYKYFTIQDDELTLRDIIEKRGWWDRKKMIMPDEEEDHNSIASYKSQNDSETLYVRFILIWLN